VLTQLADREIADADVDDLRALLTQENAIGEIRILETTVSALWSA
jgi:hypothetical protein